MHENLLEHIIQRMVQKNPCDFGSAFQISDRTSNKYMKWDTAKMNLWQMLNIDITIEDQSEIRRKKGPMIKSPKFPIQTDNPINAANIVMSLAEN